MTWSPLQLLAPVDLTSGRPALTPARFDPAIPGNAAKLDAVERLLDVAGQVGCTLPELALAFTTAHPAVTSTIIGPRTME
ncbi:aldo/keto reductase [Micromonospora olivasterospora]|uniref:Aldo/keto reductase family protein n=1 Tax=Micromonospora olivasterospora TaxID=1880 RepID=A0A562IFI7_MICOL|nr:aldo/keto reductase [Micromonospora olivasterospora]TWH69767.1 aldo/keto reductase family protein [Micromonospora olivasterospora]